MPNNLKALKNRIKSVKSTQKITKAMKMVSAAKLRRAQERAEAARPYADRMQRMLASLASSINKNDTRLPLLTGTGKYNTHLILVITSDRGLCGAFNSSIVKVVKQRIEQHNSKGWKTKIITVGKKAAEQLKPYSNLIIDKVEGISKKQPTFSDAEIIAQKILKNFGDGAFDVCHLIYSDFKSIMTQVVTLRRLIPLDLSLVGDAKTDAIYEYEPNEETILNDILPRNISIQIYHALLESAAGEQASRMRAMDNATRNAGEMINSLTLKYNRTRQAAITKELIEIISGAEAV